MKRYPCYIQINQVENFVFATGISFKSFMKSLADNISNILILKGYPRNAELDTHTFLEYVTKQNISEFLKEDIYHYGDFCWIDVSDSENIAKLSDTEIAKLLFAAHLKRPLDNPFFDSLQNAYLYLSHDDDYWTKIYIKNVEQYKTVLEYTIRENLIGRKKFMSAIPNEILNELYDLCQKGVIFDFESCYTTSDYTAVTVFSVGKKVFNADDIHTQLDHERDIICNGKCLEYKTKTKKWTFK